MAADQVPERVASQGVTPEQRGVCEELDIQVAVANGSRRSPWIEFGEVQPQLEIAGEDLIVRCLPDQQFLLLAVPPREAAKDGRAGHGSGSILG